MSFFGNTAQPSGGLFGNTNTSSANNTTTTSGTNTGGGLFGGGGGGLFGAANTAKPTPPATGGLFGAVSTTTPAATTGTAGGGLFGNTASTTTPAAPAATGGGLFGKPATTSAFGATPAASSSTTANSGTPSLFGGFGAKPADTNATTAAKPAATPNFFGTPSTSTATTAPAAAAPAAGGLFGAAKPADSTTSTTPAAPTGGLFGAKPAAPAAASSTAAPAAAPAAPLGLFGAKPAEKKDEAAPAVAPFTLGTKTEDKAAASSGDAKTPATNTANPLVAVPPPSMLRGKTIEEIVNRWTSDLEKHVDDFTKFAGEVVVWDRALIENGNNIAALYAHVVAAERQQTEIDQTLDHVEQQQKELLATLEAYEKVSQELLGGQGGGLRSLDTGPADTERDKNYMLATDLHTNLDDLSTSLTQMIDSVNALSTTQKPNEGAEDPMNQISQVLSSHLESLQWIDTAARELDGKVSDIERRLKESGQSYGNGSKGRGSYGLNR